MAILTSKGAPTWSSICLMGNEENTVEAQMAVLTPPGSTVTTCKGNAHTSQHLLSSFICLVGTYCTPQSMVTTCKSAANKNTLAPFRMFVRCHKQCASKLWLQGQSFLARRTSRPRSAKRRWSSNANNTCSQASARDEQGVQTPKGVSLIVENISVVGECEEEVQPMGWPEKQCKQRKKVRFMH